MVETAEDSHGKTCTFFAPKDGALSICAGDLEEPSASVKSGSAAKPHVPNEAEEVREPCRPRQRRSGAPELVWLLSPPQVMRLQKDHLEYSTFFVSVGPRLR